MMHGMYNAAMNEELEKTPEEPVAEETPVVEEEVVETADADDEGFTIEKGKERAAAAVGRVKQAGKEFGEDITTRPLLDAVGSYFTRGIDALISLAEGLERKKGSRK